MNKEVVYINLSTSKDLSRHKRNFIKKFEDKLRRFEIDGYDPELRILESFRLHGDKMENKIYQKQIKDKYIDQYSPILNDISFLLPEEKEKIQERKKRSIEQLQKYAREKALEKENEKSEESEKLKFSQEL